MPWLVDLDAAVADRLLDPSSAAELKRRAREEIVETAVNIALFLGVVMVIGGAVEWLKDRLALAFLGFALTVAGAVLLLRLGPRTKLVANATAAIGAALTMWALGDMLFEGQKQRVIPGLLLGAPAAALGFAIYRFAPRKLAVLGGWLLLLGAAAQVFGLLTTESQLRLAWLVLHYVGALTIACGVFLNLRFVTGVALVPLAAALSSETFYGHAAYGLAIYESTLTLLQMSAIALFALAASRSLAERFARHARLIGQLAFIWINMAFWIGSLWGDVLGQHLWGPRWDDFKHPAPAPIDWIYDYEGFQKASEAFKEHALTISADVYTAAWAVVILAMGAWGAIAARRAVLNIALVFGAIHFYTQFFERFAREPLDFLITGVIAILAAWGLWHLNRLMPRQSNG